jgi:pimeloyl-ACP methyl ester carboxylesterase
MAAKYPPDPEQVRAQSLADFKRSYYPVGFQRQYAGIIASGDRRAKLKTITAPTVVIHGDADPLVPLAGGQDTAANIPGAELIVVPGVGHEMPAPTQAVFVNGILSAVARAKAPAAE